MLSSSVMYSCYWCNTDGYCSERCLDDDWRRYHWAECKRVSVLRSVWPHAQLCLRIAAQFTSGMYVQCTGALLSLLSCTGYALILAPLKFAWVDAPSNVKHACPKREDIFMK